MTAGLVDDLLMTCSKSYEFKKSNKLDCLAGLSLAQLSPSLFILLSRFQRKISLKPKTQVKAEDIDSSSV